MTRFEQNAEFDSLALFAALDAQRDQRGLSWPGVARSPESFLRGATTAPAGALPAAGPDRRLRWNLHMSPRRQWPGLYEAMDDRRRGEGLTWPELARELRCSPHQLTGLRAARFAISMALAMRITQWLRRPAADFIYAARW